MGSRLVFAVNKRRIFDNTASSNLHMIKTVHDVDLRVY